MSAHNARVARLGGARVRTSYTRRMTVQKYPERWPRLNRNLRENTPLSFRSHRHHTRTASLLALLDVGLDLSQPNAMLERSPTAPAVSTEGDQP